MSLLAALVDLGSALAFGLLAGIAPCVITANIAAVAYVSQRASDPRKTVLAGAAYSLGRVVAYSIIGLVILFSGSALADQVHDGSTFISLALAAIFILSGAVALGAIRTNFTAGQRLISKYKDVLYEKGTSGAFAMGLLFALAFCPVSASIFFGALVPLVLSAGSTGMVMPALFGVGTALPVFAFAYLLTISVSRAHDFVERVRAVEPLITKVFGAGMVAYGIFLFVSITS